MTVVFENRRSPKPRSLSLAGAMAAVAVAAAALVAGCCGGAPSHGCDFAPVKPDAARDLGMDLEPGSVQCGKQACTPGETCCITMDNNLMCLPPTEPCKGFRAECDGPEDCGGSLRCCAIPAPPYSQSVCRLAAACPGKGIFDDGTAVLCHGDKDCPPEWPSCTPVMYMGIEVRMCLKA